MYRAFCSEGRAIEDEVQKVHAEARTSRESCGYEPNTPYGEGASSDDVNRLDLDSWYENSYPVEANE